MLRSAAERIPLVPAERWLCAEDGGVHHAQGSDRLVSEFENNREQYQGYWSDINPFVKYGCIKDKKFYDRVKGAIIFKTVDGEYLTLEEYKAKNPEKQEKTVYYCNDAQAQARRLSCISSRASP